MPKYKIMLSNFDKDDITRMLILQLQDAGYDVLLCEPEPQAFHHAAAEMKPAAVIVDLRRENAINAAEMLLGLPLKVVLLVFSVRTAAVEYLERTGAIAFDGAAVAELPQLMRHYIEINPVK